MKALIITIKTIFHVILFMILTALILLGTYFFCLIALKDQPRYISYSTNIPGLNFGLIEIDENINKATIHSAEKDLELQFIIKIKPFVLSKGETTVLNNDVLDIQSAKGPISINASNTKDFNLFIILGIAIFIYGGLAVIITLKSKKKAKVPNDSEENLVFETNIGLDNLAPNQASQPLAQNVNIGVPEENLFGYSIDKKVNFDIDKVIDIEIKWCNILAKKGDVDAVYTLACYYVDGYKDVPKDQQKALELFKKAAEFGHLKARQIVIEYS